MDTDGEVRAGRAALRGATLLATNAILLAWAVGDGLNRSRPEEG